MRELRMGLALLGTLAFAGVSQAANGTVDMTWDSCAGPVDKTTPVSGVYSLFISEIGLDQVHIAYDVRFVYGNAAQTVPDAWRFDANGCEAGLMSMDASSKLCPSFAQNANANALQIKKVEFSPPFDPYATTLMRVVFAVAYSSTPITPVPTTRYLLGRFGMDLTVAVAGPSDPNNTCGGFEEPMCFQLSNASWLDPTLIERKFNVSSPPLTVSFNGPSACSLPVPARPTTWGAIKGQYRQ